MAAFTKDQIRTRTVRVTKDPPRLKVVRVECSLSSQGGDGANKIGANALGVSEILSVTNLYDRVNGKIYLTATDGQNVYIADDLTDGDIADISTTGAHFGIVGVPLL